MDAAGLGKPAKIRVEFRNPLSGQQARGPTHSQTSLRTAADFLARGTKQGLGALFGFRSNELHITATRPASNIGY